MKSFIFMLCGIALAGLLLGSLNACSAPAEEPEAPAKTGTLAAPEDAAPVYPDARTAYAALLREVLATQTLPDGTELDHAGTETLDWNEFAVYDLDGDEQPELILSWTNASMAGMMEVVYGFDAASGQVRELLRDFPGIIFYENGAARAFWSHNQGLAGTFWPYNLYQRQAGDGSYKAVGSADAWEKSYRPYGFNGEPFPDDADIDGDGFVYFLLPASGTMADAYKTPVDGPAWDDWQRDLVGDVQPLDIPFMSLTEEFIAASLESGTPFGIPVDFIQSDVPAPFARAIEAYCRTGILPDGQETGAIPETISYAVFDVDGDGQEELILQNQQTIMAGMFEKIYACDESSGTFREKFSGFPDLIYFDGGIIHESWSHNQGRAGEKLWPYDLYQYQPNSDTYELLGSVDGWDRELGDYVEYLGGEFPQEVDADGDGFVYLLLPPDWEGHYSRAEIVDGPEHMRWREQYRSGDAMDIPYRAVEVTTFFPNPAG